MLLHKAAQKLTENINQSSHLQNTPGFLTKGELGMSVAWIAEKIDRVMTAGQCAIHMD